MGGRPFGSKYYEDPSIARCCAVEYERVWQRIADRVAKGEWFYVARERVLAEELPDIHKAFGTVVAQRVSKAIQHTSPDQIPKWAKAAKRGKEVADFEEWLTRTRGKVSWINRLSLRFGGIPFW
jgi:hypothetical protein